jgi:hypothetical protein
VLCGTVVGTPHGTYLSEVDPKNWTRKEDFLDRDGA